MTRTWMPLYIGDYLRDTAHLSAAEHGAYLLLIMHYWQQGELPAEDKRLARIARMLPDEWADSRDTLAEFFDENWRHSRIDEELQAAAENSAKAREKAAKRWANREEPHVPDPDPNPKPKQSRGNAPAMPQHVPGECPSPSPVEPNGSDNNQAQARKPHRLPADYRISEPDRAFARSLGWSEAEIDDEEAGFVDYWASPALKASAALKTNWGATWRRRIRDVEKRRGPRRARAGPPPRPARAGYGQLALVHDAQVRSFHERDSEDPEVEILPPDRYHP